MLKSIQEFRSNYFAQFHKTFSLKLYYHQPPFGAGVGKTDHKNGMLNQVVETVLFADIGVSYNAGTSMTIIIQ